MYRATRAPLLAYFVRRTTDPHTAADLLAHVYLVAWQKRESLPPDAEQRLWLFGVARNVLANHRRRTMRDLTLTNRLGAALAAATTAVPDDPDSAALRTALANLREDDRELLMLAGWEGLSPAEIAQVTGRAPGAVRVALHRARARLRAALNDLKQPEPIR